MVDTTAPAKIQSLHTFRLIDVKRIQIQGHSPRQALVHETVIYPFQYQHAERDADPLSIAQNTVDVSRVNSAQKIAFDNIDLCV